MRNKVRFLIFLGISFLIIHIVTINAQISEGDTEDVGFCDQLSDPLNVCIDEYTEFGLAEKEGERPVAKYFGSLYWQRLPGSTLNFFINTSDIIGDIHIYDPKDPDNQNLITWELRDDRLTIRSQTTQFAYEFLSYYDPDYVGDTGFIVVINSQVVNFPTQDIDGELIFFNVDYRGKITLPPKAGVVTYAPTDGAKLVQVSSNPERFAVQWEYRNREMDSKHDPLLMELTYTFDDLYLQFTKLLYQNQIQKQQLQDELQRQDILNATIQIIAFLSILASLISILFAYLLARRKYEPEKKRAKELPRRQAIDVERSHKMDIQVRNLFSFGILLLLFLPTVASVDAQVVDEDIQYFSQIELFENNVSKITVEMALPTPQNTFKIWDNISAIDKSTIRVYNVETGETLIPEIKEDHILINSPPQTIGYSYSKEYHPYSVKGMLVFLDRFWLEFYNPNNDPAVDGDTYLQADLDYNVVLPADAIIYSASPSDKVQLLKDDDGRRRLRFLDNDRQIDAFHDAWEVQVSYSFITILEALENLNVDYENIKVEQKTTLEYIQSAQQDVLIFALLGIIAPIISFLIAYWVFRNHYLKEIQKIQDENEEQIFVEPAQIEMFNKSIENQEGDLRKAFLGHYYLLKNSLSNRLKKDIDHLSEAQIEREVVRLDLEVDLIELFRLLNEGEIVTENPDTELSYSELFTYASDVENLLRQI